MSKQIVPGNNDMHILCLIYDHYTTHHNALTTVNEPILHAEEIDFVLFLPPTSYIICSIQYQDVGYFSNFYPPKLMLSNNGKQTWYIQTSQAVVVVVVAVWV